MYWEKKKKYQHLFSPCTPKNNKYKLAYLNKDTFIELIRKNKQLSRKHRSQPQCIVITLFYLIEKTG